jgi:hypothetical protein
MRRLADFVRMGFGWGLGGGSLRAFTFTHLRGARGRATTTAYVGIVVPVHPSLFAVGSGQRLRCGRR